MANIESLTPAQRGEADGVHCYDANRMTWTLSCRTPDDTVVLVLYRVERMRRYADTVVRTDVYREAFVAAFLGRWAADYAYIS